MTDVVSGTITFLFTDIEGSTPLVERLGERYDQLLSDHHRILRAAFAAHHGREHRELGDGFCVAFSLASDALKAALDAQLGVAAYAWPSDAQPTVRMGLHAGEARLTEDGYRGLAIHQAQRVCSAAHGGQVLLSQTTRDLVASELPPDVLILELGEHRVRDFAEPQSLYQLVHPALRAEFPPLRSAGRVGSRLPVPRTSFVGRENELDEVRKLLADTRLLTLIGPGGCGKTRISLEVASAPDMAAARRVWFVELGPIEDPDAVPRAIASTLGVPDDPERRLLEAIAASIASNETLLVVDNCEHVAESSAAAIDELLGMCPGLRVLATSREALGVAGETRMRLNPLSVPEAGPTDVPEELYDHDSVRLFCDRASLSDPGFSLTAHNAAAVAAICRRLDGIPLAIELAAGRIPLLSPAELASRLDDRFKVLASSLRDVPERQRTLRGAIDWSYDMLGEVERGLLTRLALFSGTFSLEAAEAVCAGGDISGANIFELVDALVARSLVQLHVGPHDTRYRLLESIREYAAEKLAASGEEIAVRARHLRWFGKLAEQAERELHGPDQGRWLDALESDYENLRAAMLWALGHDRPEEALRLGVPLSAFWEVRGYLGEGRSWLEAALASSPPSPIQARALLRAATLARIQGDFAATRSFSSRALALLEQSGDEQGIASSLTILGSVSEGEHAVSLSGSSLSLARHLREVSGLTASMRQLGALAWEQGDHASVRALHEESLSIARRIGDASSEADSLTWLGNVAYSTGMWDDAKARYDEALALTRRLGDRRREADVLSNLGLVAQAQHDSATAADLHRQSLLVRREIGHRRGIAISCLSLAELALAAGDEAEARARLNESLSLAADLGDERIEAVARGQLAALDEIAAKPPGVPVPAAAGAPAIQAALRRDGPVWTLSFESRTANLKDSKGLRHLAVLLASPGREVHALHLVRALEGGTAPARAIGPMTDDHIDRLVVESDPFGDAGVALDDRAKAEYKARLDELRSDLDEAESWGDPERATRARAEIDALTEQLSAAVGLGGRDRKVSSASERARWSVSRAIRSALARIREQHPSLGEHLARTVHTGTFCSYTPDPRAPISWTT